MKKRYFSTLLFWGFCVSAFAQQIGELPAVWHYSYDGLSQTGSMLLERDGEAEIGGETYVQLKRTAYYTHRIFLNTDTILFPPILLRSENGIVSCYDGSNYIDTLINFNTEPGDSWVIGG